MSEEVRAAATDIVAFPDEVGADVLIVAQAWLAEHPPDDETAFSLNFCESLGFVFSNDPVELALLPVGFSCLALRRDYSIWLGPYRLAHIKTRGQLRRILSALGIEVRA